MAEESLRIMSGLGRIHLPKKMCEELDIMQGDVMTVRQERGGIFIKPVRKTCAICGVHETDAVLKPIHETTICTECAKLVRKIPI